MLQRKVPFRLKAFALILLVAQTTTLVLTMRYSQTKGEKNTKRYLVSTAVVMGEVIKFIVNFAIILIKTNKCRVKLFISNIYKCFVIDYKESLKITITAFIYTIQNNLLYFAAANLDAATYQVSYQAKILTTAFFSIVLPPRQKLSSRQWIALFLLTFGVIIVQLNKISQKDTIVAENSLNVTDQQDIHVGANFFYKFLINFKDITNNDKNAMGSNQNVLLGLISIFTAATTSGFAGIYFERVMKSGKHTMWMRNLESAAFSIIFGLIAVYFKDYEQIKKEGFFQNYDEYTVIVILLQAFGGMIIVAVVNYTDNIIKCFANACSIITSAIASYFILHDFEPSILFTFGAIIVCFSVFLYSIKEIKKKDENGMTLPRFSKIGKKI